MIHVLKDTIIKKKDPTMNSRNFTYFLGIFMLFVTIDVSESVEIKNINVPAIYELKENPEPLILDCDYEMMPSESGFVLKWLHNKVAVYQWIPTKKSPIALGSFKGRVDVNYAVDDKTKKHSSLVITQPQLSDAGNYTCNVQTYQGKAERIAELKVIDPVDSIKINYKFNEENETVRFECNVDGVAPLPEVTFWFNEKEQEDIQSDYKQVDGGIYNVEISAQLKRAQIDDDSNVACLVRIPDANYARKESITYDGENGIKC